MTTQTKLIKLVTDENRINEWQEILAQLPHAAQETFEQLEVKSTDIMVTEIVSERYQFTIFVIREGSLAVEYERKDHCTIKNLGDIPTFKIISLQEYQDYINGTLKS